MKLRPALSGKASADLEEIRQYTAEKFGDEQARRYLTSLREAFEHLSAFPLSGREIAKGSEFRCWIHQGHHRIIYRARGDRLEIGRVIHGAREAEYQRALKHYLRRSTP